MIQETRILMGMPVSVAIVDPEAKQEDLDAVFAYFASVDEQFSPYKETSETSAVNRGAPESEWSPEMRDVVELAERTLRETDGYFSVRTPEGAFNPVGIVKGWAIKHAADLLRGRGFKNFFVDAGGDIEAAGRNTEGKPWSVGIRNPFKRDEVVKTVFLSDIGIATSGTYIRGDHIFDPHTGKTVSDIVSLTVIAKDVCEADRFATAAFAMGANGIRFIEDHPGLEGYAIDRNGVATMTSGFSKYTLEPQSRGGERNSNR